MDNKNIPSQDNGKAGSPLALYIVVPCYNEQEVLPETVERLQTLCTRLAQEADTTAKILFVDDGSRDATWALISKICDERDNVAGLKLAHNAGHQNALWAGLEAVVDRCDAIVTIDADLQDDENVIVDMAKMVAEGKDIIYGIRKERRTDTPFKRLTAQYFYQLMRMAGSDIIYNHADFRMMTRRAVCALLSMPERNMFLRGMVRTLGFNEGSVYYDRTARFAGESKYPLKKMIGFAIDGITSFSIIPLRLITLSGFVFTIVAALIIIYSLIEHASGNTLPGWTSLAVSIWFVGGALLIAIGVLGTYMGKIYQETKRRPRYFTDKTLNL
ncbi:MAG: glycosyltransferase family 2 protein [Prevotella sp.]|uniref:glycosyltransferase family 2 protein n=1 Tax=Prevotella sp. TaxID=59823 RepID=UPI002A2A8FBC|nr:glycosyltransferase family 2 protein [Prevotella sp.]MDD7317347.1 glycosyltransferase family 2 protein [Prevotellaceae bacterium]MDY4019445.1 glycosyltransferase family 2 protein [Prevotella sp.]